MAVSGSEFVDITGVAYADLSSKQYYAVRTTGADTSYSAGNPTISLCIGSSGGINGAKGILQNDPSSYESASVRVVGASKLVCGEAVAVGDLITSSTAGTGIIADTTGAFFFGRAETATTAAGDVFTVRLFGGLASYMGSTA
jgi:hypothetical protein